MDHQRTLAFSPFPGDDGRASDEVRARLAAAQGSGAPSYLRAVAALCDARVLVPVVATATSLGSTTEGLTSDKEAEMSVVSLASPGGGRALLAFSGLDALQAWDARARPVPTTIDVAAAAALSDGAQAVLVDAAGPYPLVLEGEVLAALAGGRRVVELPDGTFGWAMLGTP